MPQSKSVSIYADITSKGYRGDDALTSGTWSANFLKVNNSQSHKSGCLPQFRHPALACRKTEKKFQKTRFKVFRKSNYSHVYLASFFQQSLCQSITLDGIQSGLAEKSQIMIIYLENFDCSRLYAICLARRYLGRSEKKLTGEFWV